MAQGNEVFVLDMRKSASTLQLARQIIENAGYTIRDDMNPNGDIDIIITGLRRGEKLDEELTLTDRLESTRHPKIFSALETSLSEADITVALRRLREAFVASDENMARRVAMHFVEPAEDAGNSTEESASKLA